MRPPQPRPAHALRESKVAAARMPALIWSQEAPPRPGAADRVNIGHGPDRWLETLAANWWLRGGCAARPCRLRSAPSGTYITSRPVQAALNATASGSESPCEAGLEKRG